jgi:hypothetical protein
LGAGWGRQPVVHVGLEAAVEEEGEGKGHNEQDEDKRLHGLRAVVLIAMVPRTWHTVKHFSLHGFSLNVCAELPYLRRMNGARHGTHEW